MKQEGDLSFENEKDKVSLTTSILIFQLFTSCNHADFLC